MRKILSIVLVMAMMTATIMGFTGCGKEKVTLEFWAYQLQATEDKGELENIIAKFTEELEINVNITYVSKEELDSKFDEALAGDVAPDAFYLEQSRMEELTEKGMLQDLTQKIGNSSVIEAGQFSSSSFETCLVGDELFGVPSMLMDEVNLVVYSGSEKQDAAFQLIEYLSNTGNIDN